MKTLIWCFLSAAILNACTNNANNNSLKNSETNKGLTTPVRAGVPPVETIFDTISTLDDFHDSVAFFIDADGQLFKITQSFEGTGMMAAKLSCDTDVFLGTARRNVKTTKLTKTFQTYATAQLMMNSLQTDSFMRNHNPPVSSDTNSVRVLEEKRNVTISTTYMYAIKREDDNDFHLIIGTDTTPQQSELFNVEISGLPATTSTSYATLKMVRDTIVNRFGKLCKTSYTMFSPPMKISVRGSLFYDIDHAPGIVGPAGYRPQTSWEIHPVTKITFK